MCGRSEERNGGRDKRVCTLVCAHVRVCVCACARVRVCARETREYHSRASESAQVHIRVIAYISLSVILSHGILTYTFSGWNWKNVCES